MSVRVLHTADIHLDAPFRFLGERGREQREQVARTFEKLCDLASQHDLMLIAGDLFDSNDVSQKTLEWAIGLLSDVGIPVCILPGTHDSMGPDCVYFRPEWERAANVRVSTERGEARFFDYPELNLRVHVRPVAKDDTASPLAGIAKGDSRWNIAMAHGSVLIPGKSAEDTACPIKTAEIDHSGMDYVALGHWHSWFDPGCKVRAVYPGAPEIIRSDQKSAAVASVKLSEDSAQVERLDVGVRKCDEQIVHVDGMDSADAVRQAVAALADPNLILRVTLSGLAHAGLVLDEDELRTTLADCFFHLELRNDTHVKLDSESLDFDEKTVLGRFVRSLRDIIEKTHDENVRRTAEDALQLGVALLQGKNVLR